MKYARLLHCQFPLSLRNGSGTAVSWSYWSKSGCCSAKRRNYPSFCFCWSYYFFFSRLSCFELLIFFSLLFSVSLIWIYSCWVNSSLRFGTYIFFIYFFLHWHACVSIRVHICIQICTHTKKHPSTRLFGSSIFTHSYTRSRPVHTHAHTHAHNQTQAGV